MYATIVDIEKRLTAIENHLQTATFEGGLSMAEQTVLETEAEQIRVVLAHAVAKRTGEDAKVLYEMRDQIRRLNLIAEISSRADSLVRCA